MKNKGYVLLKSLYYDHKEEYEALYESRFNSNECVHLNFSIANNPAFFLETPELMKKVVEITRLDKAISQLSNSLPGIALKQYINKCLIDEIVITNNIEGVHSTRKEIGEILDDLEGKSDKRFFGLVNKYNALITGSYVSIKDSRDIRELYDEMFLTEIIEENPKDAPDGEIFRKDHVNVVDSRQKVIHHGLYPESKIISSMDDAINILNDDDIDPLFRISIFHYLFGYIHPFYNGNGRLNRFISSYYLANTLESIMGYRLSYTIKENINKYYKSFKVVNEEINKGDITPFIFTYLDFIKESAINLRDGLVEKAKRLELFAKQLASLPYGNDEKYSRLYYYLLQASLFSEIGISTSELLQYLNVSRPTLQKRLNNIDESNLLITEKRDLNKFYQLNLDTLVDMIKN
ncbi:MAG: Fic family protein [Erysipelotrichaceae bacterium]|nr:Fic family protein [Erysipelotrichaceae bacterium]